MEPRAQRRHAWRTIGGLIKRDYAKLCAPKWLLAERHQTPSSINGAITIRYEDENPG